MVSSAWRSTFLIGRCRHSNDRVPGRVPKGLPCSRSCALLLLLVTILVPAEAQQQNRKTSLNAELTAGLGTVFRPEPASIIDGGPDATLFITPFDLGFLNLGIDIAAINTTVSVTDIEKSYTYYARFAVAAAKYFAREDWLAFPYVSAALGLWTKFVVRSDEFTSSLVAFERDPETTDPDTADPNYEPGFADNFRLGPGISVKAGFLVPLGEIVYLVLSYSIDLSYVDSILDFRVGSGAGLCLHLFSNPGDIDEEMRDDS